MGERNPYWLAFSFVPGVGLVRINRLLDAFGDLRKAWHAHPDSFPVLASWRDADA